ncbi:MAG: DegV family protein [Planctomycetota bacterium]
MAGGTTSNHAERPAIAYLDGPRLARSLAAGIDRVIARAGELNRINVFPVPDGDTGTNLALTLEAVLERLAERPGTAAGDVLAAVADAALDGARGNSGAILAQFLQGLADRAADAERLDAAALAEGVEAGASLAREAVAQPQEGTILTVLRDLAAAMQKCAQAGQRDCAVVFEVGRKRAVVSLAETPDQLPALRRAGVVDAGAQGLVDLLHGIADLLRAGRVRAGTALAARRVTVPAAAAAPAAHTAEGERFRFCTECVVVGEGIDRRRLREALASRGDSLVLAGTATKAKVHVHTDDPAAVFALAREFGTVRGEKADDMHQQADAATRRATVVVVTDSAADLPDAEAERLDVHVVPLRIQFGARSYIDRVGLSHAEFYRLLATTPEHPQTSQPTPGDFRRTYAHLLSHFEHVVSLHLSGSASGTLNAARSAAQRTGAAARLHVIDTRNASLGQGMIALRAAEVARRGDGVDAVLAAVQRAIDDTVTFGVAGDLAFAVRGGRVSRSVQRWTERLRLTPVLRTSPTGRIKPRGVLVGRRDRLAKLAAHVTSRIDRDKAWRLVVGHAQCEGDARTLQRLVEERLRRVTTSAVTELGTAFGTHGGPGTLAVGFQADP